MLAQGKHRLRAPQIHDDRTLLEAPDDAVDDFGAPVLVLLEDVVALRLADQLDDHLLGGLGQNPSEALRVERHSDVITEFRTRVEPLRLADEHLGRFVVDGFDHFAKLEELDLADLVVVAGLDLRLRTAVAPRSLFHRLFDRTDDVGLGDALVLGDLLNLSFQTEHSLTLPRLAAIPNRKSPPG